MRRLLPLLALLALGAACTQATPPTGTPSLAQAYSGKLLIGTAVEPAQLDGPQGAMIADQFSSLVAENVMKPSRLQPQEGAFEFAGADKIVTFAETRGLALRGHTLLWYKRTPDWFWTDSAGRPADRSLVLARLKQHIETVMTRYRGRIGVWDVVNEPIDPKQPSCLRDDAWFRVVGPDYLDHAFRYARAADPGARLFLNDYSTTDTEKRRCLIQIVSAMKQRGIPIDGIGHQMHSAIDWPDVAAVTETLDAVAALGLTNHITELDMTLYRRGARSLDRPSPELEALQAERYGALMRAFLGRDDLASVTWWGVADDQSWLNRFPYWGRDDAPLLFDAEFRPKNSFFAVLRAAAP